MKFATYQFFLCTFPGYEFFSLLSPPFFLYFLAGSISSRPLCLAFLLEQRCIPCGFGFVSSLADYLGWLTERDFLLVLEILRFRAFSLPTTWDFFSGSRDDVFFEGIFFAILRASLVAWKTLSFPLFPWVAKNSFGLISSSDGTTLTLLFCRLPFSLILMCGGCFRVRDLCEKVRL